MANKIAELEDIVISLAEESIHNYEKQSLLNEIRNRKPDEQDQEFCYCNVHSSHRGCEQDQEPSEWEAKLGQVIEHQDLVLTLADYQEWKQFIQDLLTKQREEFKEKIRKIMKEDKYFTEVISDLQELLDSI